MLTDKQEQFCKEYLLDFNATQAAIRASYSQKTAAVIGAENLIKPYVQNRIKELQQKAAEKFEVSLTQVIKQYYRFAFQDIRKYYNEDGSLKNIHELDDDSAAALAGVDIDEIWAGTGDEKIQIGETKKIKRWDAPKALDGLVRVLGYAAPVKTEVDVHQPMTDSQVDRIINSLRENK